MNLKKLLIQMKRYSGNLPITEFLLLKDGLLISTDLDVFVEAEVPFEGTGLIPVDKLKQITDKNDVTKLYIQDEFAIIETPKGQFKIQVVDNTEDFPGYERTFGEPFSFTLDKEIKDLKHFVQNGHNDRFKGVHFGENGEVAATDAHKIKWLQRGVKGDKIVPKQLFTLPNGDYKVSFSETHGKFQMGDVSFIIRTIDATFPDYRPVIPEQKSNPIRFKADRKELIEQVENCLIGANKDAPVVEINGRGLLRSFDIDFGTEYKGQVKSESNEAFEIAFHAAHLLQILKTSTIDQMEFKIADNIKAVLINEDVFLLPVVQHKY